MNERIGLPIGRPPVIAAPIAAGGIGAAAQARDAPEGGATAVLVGTGPATDRRE